MLKYATGRFHGIVGEKFTPDEFEKYVQKLRLSSWVPRFVVLHNTGRPDLSDWHKVTGETRMRNLAHYYGVENKWSGGPHLFIADDFIWVFNPLDQRGTHTPSWNSETWGVEVVGDYDIERFEGGVKAHTLAALATLHRKLGISPDTLRLHREDPKTTHRCPGKGIVKADVIAAVQALLEASTEVRVLVNDQPVEAAAFLQEGRCYVALRPLAAALGWVVHTVAHSEAEMGRGMETARLPLLIRESTGYVHAAEIERLGYSVVFNPDSNTIKFFAR